MRFSAYSYTNISDVIENAVSSFHTEYYQSTSNTELIGGKWSTTIPPWENGKYYWQKTITTFSDPNKAPIETKPVCITGGIGSDGRGIKSIIPEYAKNTNGTTAPVSGWSSSRPTWNQGEYIWTRFKITYNDGSNPEYTTPTCDSSWEAMNNLEIGGRNLLKSTSSITGYKPDQRNWNWVNWGTVLTNTTDTATDSIHIVTPGGDIDINSGASFYANDIKYQKGENYTFSIAIRGTFNPTDKFVAHIWYETATSNKYDSSSATSWIDNQDGINDGISSVIFQRRFISFTIPEDFDETKNKLRIVISCKKMDILLCRPQLEKGNKPTDWKRAEEDIQEQFTSVISSVSGVKSIVDKINGQITNKIWVTDINNTVNEYDNTKIKTIRDQVALQEQTLSGFNQTVKDMQTTIATKADGSTVEAIKKNVSSLTQDLSGFKTTVESTYATNDNLKNNYFTKSETQQLADKIYWIVSDSSTSSSLTLTSQALTAMTNQFVIKSPDGKRVIIQKGQILLDALKSNNYSAPTSSTGIYAAAGTFYDLSNGSITSKNFVLDSNGNVSLKGTVYATSGSFTGTIIANAGTIGGCQILEGKLIVPTANITGTLSADRIIVDDLSAFNATIGGAHITDTSIYSGMKSSVDSTNSGFYLGEDGQVSIGNKNNYIKLYKDTKGQWGVDISANALRFGAHNTDINTALDETMNETINKVHAGSRNYLPNGNFKKTFSCGFNTDKHPDLYAIPYGGYNNGIANPTTSYHAHVNIDTFGFNVVEFNESDGSKNWKGIKSYSLNNIIAKVDDSYRFSVDVYPTGTGTKLFGGFYYFKKGEISQDFYSGQYELHPVEVNKWTRLSVKVPLNNDVDFGKDIIFYIYGYDFESNSILYIKNISLTNGNVTADWSPAPEDMDDTINDVYEQMNQQNAELSVEIGEIIGSLDSTYVTQTEFGDYKTDTSNEIKANSESITAEFNKTIESLDNSTSSQFQQFYKYIKMDGENGITIGSGNGSITLTLDNDKGIVFSKNGIPFGSWDGENFHTGNIVIDVNERAQFGNFAYVPRSDGSLSFMKVG